MNTPASPAKPSPATTEKNKKKENNLKKIKQKRKKSAREKIYLGQFQEDLNFLEDLVEFQKLCQQQTKTQYTVKRKYFIRKYFLFVVKIPVKNLAISTVNYLVTKPSRHKILFFSFITKSSVTMTYRLHVVVGGIYMYYVYH